MSGALLLICAPVLLGTAVAIWLTDRGPVLYGQTRAGLHNRPFRLLKFRSMLTNDIPVGDVTKATEIREGHPLVTPLGRWIRRFKIDELPQLVNVLSGDMSLIGPRPTVPEQTEKYTEFQFRRLEVLPGITGWAQVNGGIQLGWPERIMLDVWYVDHRSFRLDLGILWRTLRVVIRGERLRQIALAQASAYADQQLSTQRTIAERPELIATASAE